MKEEPSKNASASSSHKTQRWVSEPAASSHRLKVPLRSVKTTLASELRALSFVTSSPELGLMLLLRAQSPTVPVGVFSLIAALWKRTVIKCEETFTLLSLL